MRKLLLALPVLAAGMMLHSGILRGYEDRIDRDVNEVRLDLVKATVGDRGGFDKGGYINKDNAVKNLNEGATIADDVLGGHGLTRI